MHFPLTIALRPSRRVMASILALHCGAGLALFHVPALSMVQDGAWFSASRLLAVAAWTALLLSLGRALKAERDKGGMRLTLHANGLVSRKDATDAAPYAVAGGGVDLGWAVWLPLADANGAVGPGRGRVRERLMLSRANVAPSHWRLLRIWLRHKAAPVDVA